MTDLRKAAIELLKSAPDHITEHWPELDEVCKALAQPEQVAMKQGWDVDTLLAQPEQEPVAWQFYQDGQWHYGTYLHNHRKNTEADGYPVRDLYTAPPSKQEPPAPIHQLSMRTGPTNTAWIDCDEGTYNSAALLPNEYNVRKLYTAPASKPLVELTVDEIYQAADREKHLNGFVQGALWAEAALWEKNNE